MPIILVTNDDGIHSAGLLSLFNAMKDIGDAYIIAPDRERSAVSHSLTCTGLLRSKKCESMFTVSTVPQLIA
jgi:5'-nucleotidase